jgi:hypothetical protein
MSDHERTSYPIGRFTVDSEPTDAKRRRWIEDIRSFPAQLSAALEGIDEAGLEATYRDGSWTVRQIVHHIADGHGTSFFRFKHAIAEDSPRVAAWEETLWAQTPEASIAPIEPSVLMIEGIHSRWAFLLDSMTSADFARVYRHPDKGDVTLDWLLQYHSWHGKHHVAHIGIARGVTV